MRISYIVPVLGLAVAAIGYAAAEATTSSMSCCEVNAGASQSAKSSSVVTLADVGAAATATAPSAVDVGNTKCAVEADQEASNTVTYTHEGKVYHFCCADCITDFKKSPETYIKAMNADPAKWGIVKK